MSSSGKGRMIDSLSSGDSALGEEESASGEEKVISGEAVMEKVISGEAVMEKVISGMAKSGVLKVTLLSDASESVSNTVFIVKQQ